MTTDPVPNAVINDGCRAYYEQFANAYAAERPDDPWPSFDDLSGDQVRTWMLACASNIELGVRLADALVTVTEGR